MTSPTRPFVVLLTGHPGVGKSTFARPLAGELGAACLSKDQVRFRVFDGWKPDHPVFGGHDLEVAGSIFDEDAVVWSVFFWAVSEAARVAPVVAETAMTRPQSRQDVKSFVASLPVAAAEVVLTAPPDALLERYRGRLGAGDTHRVYRRFAPGNARALLERPYEPVLEPSDVVQVDATDPSAIDAPAVAAAVFDVIARSSRR